MIQCSTMIKCKKKYDDQSRMANPLEPLAVKR